MEKTTLSRESKLAFALLKLDLGYDLNCLEHLLVEKYKRGEMLPETTHKENQDG